MGTYCQDCGNELASQYRFCSSCGGRNLGPSRPQISASRPAATPPPSSPPSSGKPPSAASIVGTTGTTYGGFWRRVGAYLIDIIVLLIPLVILSAIQSAAGDENVAAGLQAGLLEIALYWAYFALQESSSRQATIGKRVMGLLVCDLNGRRLTLGRATGRYFGKLLSGLLLCIGYFMVAFTERRQGLHDMMAGTVVLHRAAD